MSEQQLSDEALMERALELARQGLGSVEPNPMVGAVVVDPEGKVIGEGWHRRFGGPHAEVEALSAAGDGARGATLFVTLEPCCHVGKTPPCSQAILNAGLRRVVVATRDPARHGSGSGVDILRSAGVMVDVGLLEARAKQLIAPFTRLMTAGLPWVHAKWAMTLDGKIATSTGSSRWISHAASRSVVHELRGRMDGIVTGIGTVLADDPLLTARPAGPRIPTRIVVDSTCRVPVTSQLVCTARQIPVLVATTAEASASQVQALRSAGVEVLTLGRGSDGRPQLLELLQELGRRRMTNVLVEAGGQLLGSLFDQGLISEVHAFVAPLLAGGRKAPSPLAGAGIELMERAVRLQHLDIRVLENDVYLRGIVPTEADASKN